LKTREEKIKRRESTGLEKSGETEEEIFKKSRLTVGSPDGKIETEEGGVEEWRGEMGDSFDRLEN